MNSKQINILLTGAGGYIGSRLVETILKKTAYKIVVIDPMYFGNYFPKSKRIKIINFDIRDITTKNFPSNIDYVIDLAAISNDPSGEKFKKSTFEINFKGRLNIARLASLNNVKHYIMPSSSSIYGRIPNNKIADENFIANPLSNYSKANLKAENAIKKIKSDMKITFLRFGTIFGYSKRMRMDLVLNAMVHSSVNFSILPLMRDGSQRRPLLHIQDACNAIIFMILFKNKNLIDKQIFNVGSSKFSNYKILDLAKKVIKITNKKTKILWYGDPDKRSYFINFSKIEKIGFKAKYNAEYGIKEMTKHLKNFKIEDRNITLKWYENINFILNNFKK